MKNIIFSLLIVYNLAEQVCGNGDHGVNATKECYGIECITPPVSTEEDPETARSKIEVERIIGGVDTPIQDAPYMAVVLRDDHYLCGGSIVTTRHVVSAAHCFLRVTLRDGLKIRFGSDYYWKEGEERYVVELISHPDFQLKTLEADCAVLKVAEPFSHRVPYQALYLSTESPHVGEVLLISGWGLLFYNGALSSKLQSVNVTVLPNRYCDLVYKRFNLSVPSTGFCAGNLEGGRDSCKGDSGGPAVKGDELVGIVSAGLRCGVPGIPAIYTDVFKVRVWIREQLRGIMYPWRGT